MKKKELLDSDEKLKFEKTIQMQASKLKNVGTCQPSLNYSFYFTIDNVNCRKQNIVNCK